MIYDQTSLIFYQKWVYTFSKSWSLSLAYDFEPDLRLFGMISQTLTTIYALVRLWDNIPVRFFEHDLTSVATASCQRFQQPNGIFGRPKPVKRRLPSLETSTQPLRIADLNG